MKLSSLITIISLGIATLVADISAKAQNIFRSIQMDGDKKIITYDLSNVNPRGYNITCETVFGVYIFRTAKDFTTYESGTIVITLNSDNKFIQFTPGSASCKYTNINEE